MSVASGVALPLLRRTLRVPRRTVAEVEVEKIYFLLGFVIQVSERA